METGHRLRILLAGLIIVTLLGAWFLLWAYVVFFPTAFVDGQLFGPDPALSTRIQWESWVPASAWEGPPPRHAEQYSALRKGQYQTLFYTFEIVQGKASSDPQVVKYLPFSTRAQLRRGRLAFAITLVTILPLLALAWLFRRVPLIGLRGWQP